MKPTKLLFLLVAVAMLAASCMNNLQKGTQAYNQMQYDKSNYFLKKALDEKKDDAKTLRMLADGYRLTNQTRKAEYVYAKLIKGSKTAKSATPEDYLNYGKMLMADENYADAKQVFHQYDSLMEFKSDLAKYMMLSCDSVSMFHQDTAMYEANEAVIRGVGERFGATPSGNGIIICSEIQSIDQNAKQRFPWLGPGNLDLFYTEKDAVAGTNEYIKPQRLKGEVNSPAHEGPCTISNDGNTMYFSRSTVVERIDAKTKEVVKAENVLKIYSVQKADENWVNPQPLPFCSDEYSVMNPALMPDGKTMIFASDKPGGMGGSDLYIVSMNANNEWGEPHNLGANINSAGNEVFPFVSKDSMLYFSTDGRFTLGGLDVFESEWDGSNFSNAENLNIPINTSHDDYCFTTDPSKEAAGWVSSNKSGHERIYEWTRHDPILFLQGTVTDRNTHKPIVNSRVEIINDGDGSKMTIATDESGKFYYDKLMCRSSYTVKAGKEKYKVSRAIIKTKKEKRRKGYAVNFSLETIGSNVLVRNIYFAFGSFAISSESSKTLDTLAKKLRAETNIDIEIGAHTDSRGSARFNKWLSERRAQSTVNYLIKRGISKDRLAGKGYGESRPVNNCHDGVKCSDEQYALNRRIEFKIIKLRTDEQKRIDATKVDETSNNAGKVIMQPKKK